VVKSGIMWWWSVVHAKDRIEVGDHTVVIRCGGDDSTNL